MTGGYIFLYNTLVMNNVDKKVGRKKAGTWGRTTGGYSPKAAKISKRAGSKGARRVAKNNLNKEVKC